MLLVKDILNSSLIFLAQFFHYTIFRLFELVALPFGIVALPCRPTYHILLVDDHDEVGMYQ